MKTRHISCISVVGQANAKDRVNILDTEGCGALNMLVTKNSTLADRNHSCLFTNFQSDQCKQDLSGTITMVVCVNSYLNITCEI